jgi:hypothetical protein
LSKKVMAPMAAPAMVGAKTICSVQAELAASDVAQVLDAMTKLGDAVMEEMVRVWPPLLVRVRVCAADVRPMPIDAKLRDAGESETPGGAMPVPVRAMVWERNSSVMVSVADRIPVTVGMKLT